MENSENGDSGFSGASFADAWETAKLGRKTKFINLQIGTIKYRSQAFPFLVCWTIFIIFVIILCLSVLTDWLRHVH